MLRTIIFITLLALPAAARGRQAEAPRVERLTLEQAIALALDHNRLVRNEALEVEKAADRVAAARTRRLPEFKLAAAVLQPLAPFEVRFDQGSLGVFPGFGPFPPRDVRIGSPAGLKAIVSAQVTQPLTQLRAASLGVRWQEVGREIAGGKLRAQQLAVVNQVKRLYYGALQQQSALSAADETINLYRELDRVVGEYVVRQVALEAESLEVKTRLVREEYEALRLRHALESQKEQLNQLLGRDIRTAFEVTPVVETSLAVVDLAAAQASALNQRPEAIEARLRLKQAEYDRRIKRSQFVPEIGLTFVQLSQTGFEVLPRNFTAAGVAVRWEPFDWGRKRRELAEKEKAIEQARNAVHEAEARVLLEVNAQFRKLEEARALLRVGRAAEAASREKLRVAANKYRREAVLFKDVLQAQATVA